MMTMVQRRVLTRHATCARVHCVFARGPCRRLLHHSVPTFASPPSKPPSSQPPPPASSRSLPPRQPTTTTPPSSSPTIAPTSAARTTPPPSQQPAATNPTRSSSLPPPSPSSPVPPPSPPTATASAAAAAAPAAAVQSIPTAISPPASPAYTTSDVQSWHYLALKPPPSSPDASLPVPPIKPPVGPVAVPSSPLYGPSSFPLRPFLVVLLLAVPFALLARDDWRDRVVSLTPFLPWPQWMRTEAVRLDPLLLEERRRKAASDWQQQEEAAELTRLDRALRSLKALREDETNWLRAQETPEQRERREKAEAERSALEVRVRAMEEKLKAVIHDQEQAVQRAIHDAEERVRAGYLGQVGRRVGATVRQADEEVRRAVAGLEREAEKELGERLREAVQSARESEVGRGVQRIVGRLAGHEAALEAHVRGVLEEEDDRMRAYYRAEEERLRGLMTWAKAEEAALQTEYDELSDLHFLSTNIHRLNVLLLAVDAALHPSTPQASLAQPWAQLTALSRSDPVITAAAQSVPPALLEAPPPTFDELAAAFGAMDHGAMTAVYAPPPSASPSLLSHLVAHAFSFLTIPHAALLPATDDLARLSRLRWWLYADAEKDIGKAVGEAEGLEGEEVRAVLAPWMRAARERALVEQAVTVVKTRVKALELGLVDTGEHQR